VPQVSYLQNGRLNDDSSSFVGHEVGT
jgi:hypothetical protein